MYSKRPEENNEQYIWRICEERSSGRLDASWDDIANLINTELYGDDTSSYKSESAYRKLYQYAKQMYDAGVFDESKDENHLAKIRKQTEELTKERRRFYDQRREYNKILTSDARAEHLCEQLLESAQKLATEKPLQPYKDLNEENTSQEALLALSDWHYGMTTDNIWNKYNVEICRKRVSRLVHFAKKHLKTHGITTLHVVLLGDAAHGAIHTGCRVQSEEDTCDQLMHVAELLAQTINELSSVVNCVKVYSCYGNHLRTIQDKKESIHSDNMEKIIPWWLKERLKDNYKVYIIESEYKEMIKLNVAGSNICCVHGDIDNFKNLGVTMNTIFTKLYGETIDYTISGDKHHLEEFESFGIESILVRSLCGTDEYANNKRLYSDAGQTLIIFNDSYGRECTYNIPLY